MLGHVGPRRGRCNVEDLVATDTEDLRVPQALPAAGAYPRGVGDRVVGVIDQTQRGAGRTGLFTRRFARRVREERFAAGFFTNGESDDGGLPLLEESRPSWARSAATMPSSSVKRASRAVFSVRRATFSASLAASSDATSSPAASGPEPMIGTVVDQPVAADDNRSLRLNSYRRAGRCWSWRAAHGRARGQSR